MPASENTISWSEIDSWSTCRQKWSWQYQYRIEPRHSRRTPTTGSCGHEAIRAILREENWLESVDAWLEKELKTRELFDDEIEEYEKIVADIKLIIPRYLAQYPLDTFRAIHVEKEFNVPIRGMKERLYGFWDAIVEDVSGKLWMMEHKFPSQQFRSQEDIDLDGQIGVYHYAAIRSGLPIVGIIYNQILAKPPAQPKLNKDGTMSRADIRCDWPTYKMALEQAGLNPIDYVDMQARLQDKKFFERYYRFRTPLEVSNFAKDMERRVWDLRRARQHIYMSESRVNCGICPFRELCIEKLKGGDLVYLIENQFAPRRSRRDIDPHPDDIEEQVLLKVN